MRQKYAAKVNEIQMHKSIVDYKCEKIKGSLVTISERFVELEPNHRDTRKRDGGMSIPTQQQLKSKCLQWLVQKQTPGGPREIQRSQTKSQICYRRLQEQTNVVSFLKVLTPKNEELWYFVSQMVKDR